MRTPQKEIPRITRAILEFLELRPLSDITVYDGRDTIDDPARGRVLASIVDHKSSILSSGFNCCGCRPIGVPGSASSALFPRHRPAPGRWPPVRLCLRAAE